MKNGMWGAGPWDDEPDDVQWIDAATGYHCHVLRHSTFGSLCGYVGVPSMHPDAGQHYDAVDVSVHGGLTWSGPHPQREEEGWWFGFDCAHAWDLVPYMRMASVRRVSSMDDVYRNWEYVTAQVTELAAQLQARATGDPHQVGAVVDSAD